MNATSNDVQVGGMHYKDAKYQHWDLAVDLRLPYLEGQITKYIDRHPRKHGRQDLEKAAHFAQKLLECAVDGRTYSRTNDGGDLLALYFAQRPAMHPLDRAAISTVVAWTRSSQLTELVRTIQAMIALHYPGDEA
jgi:hypothetical protein